MVALAAGMNEVASLAIRERGHDPLQNITRAARKVPEGGFAYHVYTL